MSDTTVLDVTRLALAATVLDRPPITSPADLDSLVADVLCALAASGYGVAPMPEIARWFVDVLGYPFDMHTDVPPPPQLQRAITVAWIAKDGDGTQQTADLIARVVAEEGGWA